MQMAHTQDYQIFLSLQFPESHNFADRLEFFAFVSQLWHSAPNCCFLFTMRLGILSCYTVSRTQIIADNRVYNVNTGKQPVKHPQKHAELYIIIAGQDNFLKERKLCLSPWNHDQTTFKLRTSDVVTFIATAAKHTH